VEQRLEHAAAALTAFRKFLELDPKSDKAVNVRQRVAELEVASEKETQQKTEEHKAHYGTQGTGIVFGFAPFYKPAVTLPEWNSTISNGFLIGARFPFLDLLLRYSTGTIPSLRASSDPANKGSLTSYTNVKNSIIGGVMEANIPLNQPFESLGGFQFNIPVYIGGYFMFMDVPNDTHSTMAFDVGGGIDLRYYTGTFLVLDATAQYHLSMPLWKIADQYGNNIEDSNGAVITGHARGPEFRISATILF